MKISRFKRPFFGTATNKNMHTRVYSILFGGVTAGQTGEEIAAWMERRGYGDLCICPECRSSGFKHAEGCSLNQTFIKMFAIAKPSMDQATEAIQSANPLIRNQQTTLSRAPNQKEPNQ